MRPSPSFLKILNGFFGELFQPATGESYTARNNNACWHLKDPRADLLRRIGIWQSSRVKYVTGISESKRKVVR
jgi:hypothetical protein